MTANRAAVGYLPSSFNPYLPPGIFGSWGAQPPFYQGNALMAADVFQCPQCSESIVRACNSGGPGFAITVQGTPGSLLESLPKNWRRHPCKLWGAEPEPKPKRRKRPRWLTVLVGGRK